MSKFKGFSPLKHRAAAFFILWVALSAVVSGCSTHPRSGGAPTARDTENLAMIPRLASVPCERVWSDTDAAIEFAGSLGPDGLLVGTAGGIVVRRRPSEVRCWSFSGHPQPFLAGAVGSGAVFVQDRSLGVVVYNPLDGGVLAYTSLIATRVKAIAASGDSVLLGGVDGVVYRWFWRGPTRVDADGAPRQIERYIGHSAPIESLVWHPSGATFFSGDANGIASGWEVYEEDRFGGAFDRTRSEGPFFTAKVTRTVLTRPLMGEAVSQLAISEDGSVLALGTPGGNLELWRVAGLELMDSVIAGKASILKGRVSEPVSLVLDRGVSELAVLDRLNRVTSFPLTLGLDKLGIGQSYSFAAPTRTDSIRGETGARFLLRLDGRAKLVSIKAELKDPRR